jgi:hypothetical protein
LCLREHTPVADKDKALKTETRFQLLHLIRDGGRITGIARIDRERHWPPLMIGEGAVHNDRFPFFIPVMTEPRQRTGVSLIVAARDIIENQ